MKMNMNNEIKKYQGQIYYFDRASHDIKPADWIENIDDYNHDTYQLHHVVPYTDWSKNTKNVQEKVGHNALILLPKVMHQHLENPIYRLDKSEFERVWGIHPDTILFDINSRIERTRELFLFLNSISEGNPDRCDSNSNPSPFLKPNHLLELDDLTEADIDEMCSSEGVVNG